jgi:hypothetical protein
MGHKLLAPLKRIACFPDPIPDEIFYSVLARHQEHLGITSGKLFSEHVFGSENVIATVEFPSCLQNFVSALPPGHNLSIDQIIDGHTILPYFSPFMTKSRVGKLRQDMAGANGPRIHFRAGLMASRIPIIQKLRYCPGCLAKDQEDFGEGYWHRIHQVSGVMVCPIHFYTLVESIPTPRQSQNRQTYVTLENAERDSRVRIREVKDIHIRQLAMDAFWLLNHGVGLFQDARIVYRRKLFEMGLCNYEGRILSPKKLITGLRGFFPPSLFRGINCEYLNSTDNWILQLVRGDKATQHPLMHLLFMQFIGLTAEQTFTMKIADPFGEPGWPCLNPICEDYQIPVISEVKIIKSKYASGKPIGEFVCGCGFKYRRKGPDNSSTDKYHFDKVGMYGMLWEKRLINLWNNREISVREIGRTLKVDSRTVKFQARRLGLSFPRIGPRISKFKSKSGKPVKQRSNPIKYRRTWLRLMEKHQAKGIKVLRQLSPKTYAWLYRYDSQWLNQHKPQSPIAGKASRSKQVDWKKRDEFIVHRIHELYLFEGNNMSKPVRTTISSIGKAIGQLAILQKHMDKLPKTAEVAASLIESREDFAVRKIFWAVNLLRRDGSPVQLWKVVRTAGIDRHLSNAKVIDALKSLEL